MVSTWKSQKAVYQAKILPVTEQAIHQATKGIPQTAETQEVLKEMLQAQAMIAKEAEILQVVKLKETPKGALQVLEILVKLPALKEVLQSLRIALSSLQASLMKVLKMILKR